MFLLKSFKIPLLFYSLQTSQTCLLWGKQFWKLAPNKMEVPALNTIRPKTFSVEETIFDISTPKMKVPALKKGKMLVIFVIF